VPDLPSGARLFARYAYAPNHLGYCGPADSAALFELAATGHTEADITSVASRFTGAWPYLCVLAELTGIGDPLDARLVRAYWTGSSLLDGVDQPRFGRMLLARIAKAGARQYWAHLTTALLSEVSATHGFHVFGVYPWTRLLPSAGMIPSHGEPPPALHVLDNCRISWGRVLAVRDDRAAIRSRRLTWDGQLLRLGEDSEQEVRLTKDGYGFVADVRVGDWLAVHWNWACDRLTADELWQLRALTDWQLDVTNARLAQEAARDQTGSAVPR
jgi:hypothetical protein